MLLHQVITVTCSGRGFVGARQGGLVVQQGKLIHNDLVDLIEGDDVVAVEVDGVPQRTQLGRICDDGFDLGLQGIKVGATLLRDVMNMSASVAVALPHDLAAGLARADVGVEGLVVVRAHAVADVPAELDEQDLTTTIGVHLLELLLDLRPGQLQAQLRQPALELAQVHAAIATADLAEDHEELVEPEQVQQEIGKLVLVNPSVSLLTAERRLLVGPHQRGLVVQPRRPRATADHLEDKFVDLREANDVVAVKVESLPQRLQGVGRLQA
mmetsp:Transcript_36729/g.95137  ORF Transcript_36729/g.95137 Transcript_36729/m.95137 type:complete len:269 (+) Transcript_36729:417-1223(+)